MYSNEMVQVSTPWVTPGDPAHQVINSTPELRGVLPALIQAYGWLQILVPDVRAKRDAELSARSTGLDQRHDVLARVISGVLSVLVLIARDPQVIEELLKLLLPKGLSQVTHTYRSEAGHMKVIATQLTDEQWRRLEAVKFDDTDMAAIVKEWIAVGTELGEVEKERARLRQPDPTGPANANEARLNWVRAVNALTAMAKLAGLDEEQDHLLFNELRVAEATADARAQRTGSEEQSEENSSDAPEASSDEAAAPESAASSETPELGDAPASSSPSVSTGPPATETDVTTR